VNFSDIRKVHSQVRLKVEKDTLKSRWWNFILDEIAEMPLTTQVKVLRAIEFKEFMRIGAETVTKVDVRIIAATNKDLQEEVNSRRFREDLFFRLKAVSLSILH